MAAPPESVYARRIRRYGAALFALALSACAPRACSAEGERRLAREVELLVSGDETAARAAEEALVLRGAGAIAVIETGLYRAEPPGRRRVIDVLVRIGDPEALPILEHLAQHDPDRSVRKAARRGAAKLRPAETPRAPP